MVVSRDHGSRQTFISSLHSLQVPDVCPCGLTLWLKWQPTASSTRVQICANTALRSPATQRRFKVDIAVYALLTKAMANRRPAAVPSLACLLFVLALASTTQALDRGVCKERVSNLLKDGTLTRNDTVFYRDANGNPMSDPDNNPNLTRQGCNEICGTQFDWYVDIGPRLGTWLIPVFLLLSNLEVSPLDKRRYLMILHLLGDPVGSLWSLLLKLEAYSRCYRLAYQAPRPNLRKSRNLATLLGGIEELVGCHTSPLVVYNAIEAQLVPGRPLDVMIGRAAQRLADNRTDERLRTLLATALYLYQLLSAFVTVIGGGGLSPPGGRIGTAMFMTWLIPTVLLSNAIGNFPSARTCFDILEDFFTDATDNHDFWSLLKDVVPLLRNYKSFDLYYHDASSSGAIYTCRPSRKVVFSTGPQDRHRYSLLFLAALPIISSAVVASVLLYYTPPVSINCRNFLIFGITLLYLVSFFGTSLIPRLFSWFGFSGSASWYAMLAKDALVSIPSVLLIFLSSCGLFNSCWCWSGVYSLGARGRVPLNAVPEFSALNKVTYPVLVGVCLVLQLSVFVAMMWSGWVGWGLMRWSEKEKRTEWERVRERARRTANKTR
jgi:hypothetical protein